MSEIKEIKDNEKLPYALLSVIVKDNGKIFFKYYRTIMELLLDLNIIMRNDVNYRVIILIKQNVSY